MSSTEEPDSDGISSLTSSFYGHDNDHEDGMDYEPTVVTASSASAANDDEEERLEAGLQIFGQEIQNLYKIAMARAGYSPEEARPSHERYQNFAFHAWRRECETVQRLMQQERTQGPPSPGEQRLMQAQGPPPPGDLEREFPVWAEARAFLERMRQNELYEEEEEESSESDTDYDAPIQIVG